MNEPWTQITVQNVIGGKIQFITPDVAIMDGASTVEGTMTLARDVPLLVVLKKEKTGRRISIVRVLRGHPVNQGFQQEHKTLALFHIP
jgi:hypothetical protein